MKRLRTLVLVSVAFATAGALLAQVAPADSIPNWSAPATWSPARADGALVPMNDISFAHPFVAVNPCRIADTRAGQGFGGQAGPGPLVSFMNRSFQIAGSPGTLPAPPAGCDTNAVPVGAEAVSVTLTVVFPTSSGNLVAWPTGGALPNVSVLNWDAGTVALANSTVVPLSAAGAMSLRLNTAAAGQTAEVVIDINGYYSGISADTGTPFSWSTDNTGTFGAGIFENTNTGSGTTFGVVGRSNSTGTNSAGVRGVAFGLSGKTAGVWGQSLSTTGEAAGVYGLGQSGATTAGNCCGDLGVLGESRLGYGTVGLSESTAGLFLRFDSGGNVLQFSWIATDLGSDYAFYAANGNYGGTGAKYFVEPHPSDPTKIIKYVSLEGPESGTYFRGKGKFQRGTARIEIPEDFRIVTAEEGLSIQVTPIGQMATVAVLNIGLDGITVRGSRDVEFFFTVNGIRRAEADHKPIVDAEDGGEFMPMTADFRMPAYKPELARRLIQNGTYNADGTPNMETARKLGWDRIWQEKANRVPVPAYPE